MKKVKLFVFLVLSLCFSVLVVFGEEAHAADMHRLYNPNSGEHFYTATAGEKNHLVKVGWKYEGIGWIAPSSGNAVYRLYNPNAGDHHYTMNAGEKNNLVKVGWKYEGIGWYSDVKKAIPLYRAYNPNAKAGSHNYTVNYAEQKNLLRVGWRDEGIAWYGINKSAPVTKYSVTVKHVGSDGKELKKSTASVEKGKSYTAKAESFSGYTLKGSSSQTVTVNGNKTITFNYTKNAAPVTKYTVTVKYVDSSGKEIEKAVTASVEKGKTYEATAKSISGYTLKGNDSQTVTVDGNKTITFTYTKNVAPVTKYTVTVKYVDSSGKEIEKAVTASVEKGKTYKATAKSISGYTLKGNDSQTVTVDGNKTITFTYTKNAAPVTKYTVTIKHVGSDGKELKKATVNVEKGKPYTAKAETFTGYTLNDKDVQTISAVNADQTLTFNYTKNKYTITVKYVDSTGNNIKTATTQIIEHGKSFSMTAPVITGYTVVAADKTKSIASVTKNETVTFNYTKNKYTITAKYLDSTGNNIKTATTQIIEHGKSFSMTAPDITGYTVMAADKTKTIASVSKNETVTFRYTKNPVVKYKITVKYVDETDKEIKTATTTEVEPGKTFSMTAPDITGYTVMAADKTKTIASVSKNETVTFRYTKNPVVKYKITVKYVDTENNTIKAATTESVENGKTYTATAPTINGYTVKGNNTKTISPVTSDVTLTFVYNNLAFDKVTLHAIVDGEIVKSVTFKVKPGEVFNPSLDKLDLDPNKYDLSLRPLHPVVTGKGGRELEFNFEVTLFKNYVTPEELQIMQQTIIDKVNELRTTSNPPVSALKLDSKLTIAVNIRAQELIELYDPNHLRPNGTSCMTVLTEQGISYRTAGENIAWIDSRETSGKVLGERMFTSWFNSAGHKRNMLDPNFQYIGVGVSCHGTTVYGAQLFIGR